MQKKKLSELFKNRKLQVDIVTIFMILVASTSFFIISFTYSRNYKSIMNFSRTTIQRSANLVLEKIDCLIHDFEQIPEAADGLIMSRADVTTSNRQLMSYMKDLVKVHPSLTAFYVGTLDGSLLEVINLKVARQTHYLSEPSKALPDTCLYAIRYVDRSIPNPTENYYYLNKDYVQVSQENIAPVIFDSRSRPWYTGVLSSNGIYWTNVYQYDPTNEPGITVATPIFDAAGNFMGASGADLSLTLMSKFLKEQDVSKSGKALILDNQTGNILLPLDVKNHPSSEGSITNSVITRAYLGYQQNKKTDFLFEENGVQYLTAFNAFPIAFGNEWLIMIIAPLEDFFGEILQTQKQVVVISICIFLIAGTLVIFFSKRISRPISILAKEIDKIKHLELDSTLRIKSNISEISMMDSSIAAMRSAISSFSKYVPKEIVRRLIKQGQDITIGGEKKDITIMFCDIVGFTPIAEKLPVDTLMPLLAEYFDELSRVILQTHGTIDKYIGDSIMAFWGAPDELTQPWSHACEAALRCQAMLKTLNSARLAKNEPQFITKFGIDAGMVIVGNIGTNERINYTAIGDAVNTAARLQSVNSIYHTSIIISENIYQHVKEQFLSRPLDIVMVKGKLTKIKIYELMAKNDSDPLIGTTPELKSLAEGFAQAYKAFEQDNKAEALRLFKELSLAFPEDEPSKFLIKKIQETGA